MDNASQTSVTPQVQNPTRRWESDYEDEHMVDCSTAREPSPMSRWAESQKRKSEASPPPTVASGACELEARLQYMQSALKTAAHEAKMACNNKE